MKKHVTGFFVLFSFFPYAAHANIACPAAKNLPQLVIREPDNSPLQTEDDWQIFLNNTPISDMQLAQMAQSEKHVRLLQNELASQKTWVYVGLGVMALGTALSSTGWALFGQDRSSPGQGVSLSLGLGGIALGLSGLVTVSHFIRTPLEPFLAPTPAHRLTREEVRNLISIVNNKIYKDVCTATRMIETAP